MCILQVKMDKLNMKHGDSSQSRLSSCEHNTCIEAQLEPLHRSRLASTAGEESGLSLQISSAALHLFSRRLLSLHGAVVVVELQDPPTPVQLINDAVPPCGAQQTNAEVLVCTAMRGNLACDSITYSMAHSTI